MFTFLVVLILITASLLILAVLVQNSKKEGLGNVYLGGDSGASQLMGIKKTSDLLEQITWGLVTTLFLLTFIASLCTNKGDQSDAFPVSPNISRAQEQATLSDTLEQDPPTPQSDQTPEK